MKGSQNEKIKKYLSSALYNRYYEMLSVLTKKTNLSILCYIAKPLFRLKRD
ncbi:MAG TPA: hypothetical protein PK705_09510 [Clostridia bacterium]|nr:hypothetical protein [Clostridiaceae bacterium]HQM97229.1 hypothetical protein [Clostridia bacterium]